MAESASFETTLERFLQGENDLGFGHICPRRLSPHFHKRSSSSLGRGSLRSSGTVNSPLAEPRSRFCRPPSGTSFATGFPASAIVTSSPNATGSSRRDKSALASSISTSMSHYSQVTQLDPAVPITYARSLAHCSLL